MRRLALALLFALVAVLLPPLLDSVAASSLHGWNWLVVPLTPGLALDGLLERGGLIVSFDRDGDLTTAATIAMYSGSLVVWLGATWLLTTALRRAITAEAT